MKGTGVWISTSVAGVREKGVGGDRTTVSTETLLSGEMQTWRARVRRGGHAGVTGQMGRQQEVTLWVGTGVRIPVEETTVA